MPTPRYTAEIRALGSKLRDGGTPLYEFESGTFTAIKPMPADEASPGRFQFAVSVNFARKDYKDAADSFRYLLSKKSGVSVDDITHNGGLLATTGEIVFTCPASCRDKLILGAYSVIEETGRERGAAAGR